MGVDTNRILEAAHGVGEHCVAMLAGVVSYVGVEPGLKGRVLNALATSRDWECVERLEPLLRKLDDSEILWLIENGEELRGRDQQRREVRRREHKATRRPM